MTAPDQAAFRDRLDRAESAERDIGAVAAVLAAQVNPRDIKRARLGMHRRMYVDAETLIALIDAIEQHHPGLIARLREGQ